MSRHDVPATLQWMLASLRNQVVTVLHAPERSHRVEPVAELNVETTPAERQYGCFNGSVLSWKRQNLLTYSRSAHDFLYVAERGKRKKTNFTEMQYVYESKYRDSLSLFSVRTGLLNKLKNKKEIKMKKVAMLSEIVVVLTKYDLNVKGTKRTLNKAHYESRQ